MARKKKVLIAAGGTGGHILPARFIAECLRDTHAVEVAFIGVGRELEKKLLDDEGFKRFEIPISGIHKRGLQGLFLFLLRLPLALYKSVSLLRKEKPDVIVGGGAYISVVPVLAAWLLGIPRLLHEAEPRAGIANKFLARFANVITTAYSGTAFKGSAHVVHTGQPLRPELENFLDRNKSLKKYPKTPKNILVLGGSQGSRNVDNAVLSLAALFKKYEVNILHQCWHKDVEKVSKMYQEHGLDADVRAFINEPMEAYAFADLLIARAGAGITREVESLGVPSIFIPLPGSKVNNHQYDNAKSLQDKGLALIVIDDESVNERLQGVMHSLLEGEQYQELTSGVVSSPHKGATERVVSEIMKLYTGKQVF